MLPVFSAGGGRSGVRDRFHLMCIRACLFFFFFFLFFFLFCLPTRHDTTRPTRHEQGTELQPILPSSQTLFFGAPRVRRTYYFFANWIKKKLFPGTINFQSYDEDSHARWQKGGVPEEAEIGRSSTPFYFPRALLVPPWLRTRPTRFRQQNHCALTGRIIRG